MLFGLGFHEASEDTSPMAFEVCGFSNAGLNLECLEDAKIVAIRSQAPSPQFPVALMQQYTTTIM